MKIKQLLTLSIALAVSWPAIVKAQDKIVKDSVPDNKEVKNRNVMLNASADNQPRQISIGLPSELSATIYENGSPVSWAWWPMLPYFYWASGPMYSKLGVSNIAENAVTNGSIGYIVDCWYRQGGDKFKGVADYDMNSFGLQRFDMSLSGPIAKGWSYVMSAYVNHDPGTNHLANVDLQNNKKQFTLGVSKQFNKGDIALNYKYSYLTDRSDTYGPFTYVGDGSVKQITGFNLGRDGYTPADQELLYEDVMTGEMKRIPRKTTALSQDLNLTFDYDFTSNLKLTWLSKYHYDNVHYTGLTLAGIGTATAANGFTYASADGSHKAGDVFTGDYQSRYFMHENGEETDWFNTIVLKGNTNDNRHKWRLGYNFWWMLPSNNTSSAMFTHTVEKNPVWLLKNGSQSYYYNTGGEWYDSHEIKTALYASDDWQVTQRLWLSAGVRFEYYKVGGQNARSWADQTGQNIEYANNVRTPGWNMTKATRTKLNFNHFNPSASLSGRYTITQGFGVLAEGDFTRQSKTSAGYEGPNMPNADPIDTYFGTSGIFWNTSWIKLVSQLSFIKKTNYMSNTQFSNPNDPSDVETIPIRYGVQTLGWTTDIILSPFKGFNFHGLLTLQNPKYKDFRMTANFKDGTSESYDFSNNYSVGVSKTIVEMDPSYSFNKFRIWASFRYQSKQYINRTNSLTFNGRWETFAGADYTLNKNVSFSLNLVNLFNQKGASGTISSADLVTDISPYTNYLMAGTYIRPFTVEFTTHVNF